VLYTPAARPAGFTVIVKLAGTGVFRTLDESHGAVGKTRVARLDPLELAIDAPNCTGASFTFTLTNMGDGVMLNEDCP
jgi:hypothetical protein